VSTTTGRGEQGQGQPSPVPVTEGSLALRMAVLNGPMGAKAEGAHLLHYCQVILRYRWTALGFCLSVVLLAGTWVYTARPVYRATAILEFKNVEPKILKFNDEPDHDQVYYETQLQILRSRTIAQRVVDRLGLAGHPDFAPPQPRTGPVGRARDWLEAKASWIKVQARRLVGRVLQHPDAPRPGAAPESGVADAFLTRLRVDPVPQSHLVRVVFDSYDAELAARAANAVTDAFMDREIERKVGAARFASNFLKEQLEDARGSLEASEARLNHFIKANNITFLSLSNTDPQDLTFQQLRAMSDRLLAARTERIAKESLFEEAKQQESDSLPPVLESALVRSLKADLGRLEAEQRQLAEVFKPGYPRMAEVGLAIQEVRARLATEKQNIVAGLEREYRAAALSEEQLRKAVEEQRALTRRLGDRVATYNLLRREVDTNRELYSALLARLKETGVSAGLVRSSFAVVDRAELPMSPHAPRPGFVMLLAGFIGVGGGIGLALFRGYLDRSIRDPQQVELTLQAQALALIPSHSAGRGRRRAGGHGRSVASVTDRFGVLAHEHMAALAAEAFRQLRATLLYPASGRVPRTLLVTSVRVGEGKSSVASNLAIVLGQLDAGDVLLVDGDMRRPTQHVLFSSPRDPGLSGFLAGEVGLDEVLRPTSVPNVWLLPAGEIPVNPAELLSSARLEALFEEARKRFRHIVIDSTPLSGLSDAMVIAPRVDGVILVLRHGQVNRELAQRGVQRVTSVGGRLQGVVLNDVDMRDVLATEEYKGYASYYGYGPETVREPKL
jgi:succinoglycan biosynthesis transport protein ExoP